LTVRAAAGALVLTALVATGCGSGGDAPRSAEAGAGSTVAAAAVTTTTEALPPGGRRPTPEAPLRVLMAGDSLMADISLALASTLQDGGAARARLVAAPSVPRDDATRALWRQQLDQYDPEVIVVMIGVWEGMAEDALAQQPLGSPAWERAYRTTLLEPYLVLLTSQGAEVVWVGMPPSQDPREQLEFSSMNRAVRNLAADDPQLTWVPGDEILANPDGTWTDVLPGPRGTPHRVRRLDGIHLCAEGAVRLARPILGHLRQRWDVPLATDWPNGNWRWVFPPPECPSADR
jgi:hypothetical protein